MSVSKRLTDVFASAKRIPIDDTSKIVIMSDCHRGDGSWSDNFARNQNIYFQALRVYYEQGYSYIELGDGDELWENSQYANIVDLHSHVFWLLKKFYQEKRVHFIFGNHDRIKQSETFRKQQMERYFCEQEQKYVSLFPNIEVHEALVLKYYDSEIFLVHGHQGDWLNDAHWRLTKFLVRYFWKPLELFGVNDPTQEVKNYKKRNELERKIANWAEENNQMIIAGHTHRPVFPEIGQGLYFNDGSCVHPRCITAIEIVDGEISLVKWCILTRGDGSLYIDKEVLAAKKKLTDFLGDREV